jgi:small subunit ribosomal protein S17
MAKKEKISRNIGLRVAKPTKKCDDKHCPFHGEIKVRGRVFVGTVIASKLSKSATVEWTRKRLLPKYERFEKIRTKIHVHNPPCIDAKKGERVRIGECRPVSKTKNFVIIEKVGEDIEFQQKEEGLAESKVKEKSAKEEENKGE